MNQDYNYIMQTFTENNMPNLDVCVLGALELLMKKKFPKINLPYKRPLIVGSGNAEATGRIIFEDEDAIYASESTYQEKLKDIQAIDGVVVISASGSKHAPIIAKTTKKYGKHVTLITNTDDSPTDKYLDHKHVHDEYVFPKQREPYTYNTSTYMGMILGKTKENPKKIYDYITKKLARKKLPDFRKYDKYYVIVPIKFAGIRRMIHIKFIELFGREIARDIETNEYIKHATTVVPAKNELFISIGEKNTKYGKNKLHIPLPNKADYGTIMAVAYYIIGKIQAAKKPYFKDNIENYMKQASKLFGKKMGAIVE